MAKDFHHLPIPDGPNPVAKNEKVTYQKGDMQNSKMINILAAYL